MDDIYGDLDNYNEANIVEELKNENIELKRKVDEQTTALDKLQKNILQDFDHLSSEFKNLLMNYSALLKTAKAEIERKSLLIKNLNHEKDMMVLNALQNNNTKLRNLRYTKFDGSHKVNMNDRMNLNNEKIDKSSNKSESATEKFQNLRIPSVDNISSSNTDISSKSMECNVSNLRGSGDVNHEYKENCISSKVSSAKLKSRRKSLPAIRKDVSSGEENDYASNDYRKDALGYSRKNLDTKKGSETSSLDDKYSSYKESSLETYYRSRKSKHDSDKYQSSNAAYDSDRYKRNISPDYLLRKATRNCTSRQYQLTRYTESDRYGQRSKSRDPRHHYDKVYDDRRSYSDSRGYDPYYDRPYTDIKEEKSSKYGYSDRRSGKHKYQSDYDSYPAKRTKTDKRNLSKDENVWQMDNNYTDEELFQKVIGDIQYTSCQSPDSMNAEHYAQEPVKEIKLTSESQLEDPRLKCGKYLLKSDEGVVKLSTVEKNVDLLPIDKSAWKIKKVPVPDALKDTPNPNDNEIKTAILESNRLSESVEFPLNKNLTEVRQENPIPGSLDNKEKVSCDLPSSGSKPNIPESSNKNKQTIKSKDEDVMSGQNLKKEENHKSLEKKHKSKSKKSRKCSESKSENKKIELVPQEKIKSIDDSKKSSGNSVVTPKDGVVQLNSNKNEGKVDKKLTNREIVAGDLELSDETSDNTDFDLKQKIKSKPSMSCNTDIKNHKEKAENNSLQALDTKINPYSDKSSEVSKSKLNANEVIAQDTCKIVTENKESSLNTVKDLDLSSKLNIQQDIDANDTPKVHNTTTQLPTVQTTTQLPTENLIQISNVEGSEFSKDSNKKVDSKNKIVKRAKTSKKTTTDSKPEKKPKASKEKEFVSTPIKNKFSDLFGESSSLITPEDLGLVALQSALPAHEISALSEDAQDAMDIVVNVDIYRDLPKKINDDKKIQNDMVNTVNMFSTEERSKDQNENINNDILQSDTPKSGPNIPNRGSEKETIPKVMAAEDISESSVVKTVIISTGTQQQNLESDVPVSTAAETNRQMLLNKATIDAVNSLTALATSTPSKSFFGMDQKNPDVSCNSNESRTSSNGYIANDQSSKSIPETQNSEDKPDVRLVLKRKRRIVKK